VAALSNLECSGLYASSSFRVIKLFPLEIKVVVRFCIEELSEETYYKEGGQKKNIHVPCKRAFSFCRAQLLPTPPIFFLGVDLRF
jgi:hypothetical protein